MQALAFSLLLTMPPPAHGDMLDYFPDARAVEGAWNFNYSYRSTVGQYQNLSPRLYVEVGRKMGPSLATFEAWDALYSARQTTTVGCRLLALERLRNAIGPKDFYAGRMPPAVPPQCFWSDD